MRSCLKSWCIVTLLLLPCACGSPKSPLALHKSRNETSASQPTGNGADALERDTVAAVSSAGAAPPIGLRFRLDTKPVVGMPAQLVLSLIPSPGVEINHIHAALQGGDDVQLQSPRTFDIEKPAGGVPIQQGVTVVPQRNGVLSVSATLDVDYDNGSLTRTYVIPLIAANGAS
jgi:hypothetical protein